METRHEALYRALITLGGRVDDSELHLGTATYLRAISSCECWLKHWSICLHGWKGKMLRSDTAGYQREFRSFRTG